MMPQRAHLSLAVLVPLLTMPTPLIETQAKIEAYYAAHKP